MQTAIRDASKQRLVLMKGKEETNRYQQAQLGNITATVSLMTFVGENAQKKSLETIETN